MRLMDVVMAFPELLLAVSIASISGTGLTNARTGIAIMVTVPGFNLLGDGMRDALDPRLNRS